MCNMILQKCIDQSGPLPANRSRHHPNSMFVYGVTFTADVVSTPTITQTPKVTEGLVHSQWWSTPAKTHWSWKRPLLPLYLLPSLCPHPPAGSFVIKQKKWNWKSEPPSPASVSFPRKGLIPRRRIQNPWAAVRSESRPWRFRGRRNTQRRKKNKVHIPASNQLLCDISQQESNPVPGRVMSLHSCHQSGRLCDGGPGPRAWEEHWMLLCYSGRPVDWQKIESGWIDGHWTGSEHSNPPSYTVCEGNNT